MHDTTYDTPIVASLMACEVKQPSGPSHDDA
jgi:hypothetical protein